MTLKLTTRAELRAEFRRAGLAPDQNDDAICPACRRILSIVGDDGAIELECSNGCTQKQIGYALNALANGNPDAPFDDGPPASAWMPVDLTAILAGDHPEERPDILHRTDGIGLFYRGRLHAGYGEPEACKGWFALTAAAGCIRAAEPVLYVDYEDTAANVAARLRALGASDAEILTRFYYVRADEPLEDWDRDMLLALAPAFVVIDGLTEAFAIEGLDMANNQDAAALYKQLARPFTKAGAAVLLIDHVVKDRENRGRYAIGAQHKLAGVDVAYRLDVAQPFGREREGLVKVTVTKDRPGFVRQHAADRERAALMRLTSVDGRVTVALEPGDERGTTFRPTAIMERVSRTLEDEPGLSRNAVRATVKRKSAYVDLALELLVSERFIEVRPDGQARRHYSITPYRDPGTQPGPNQDPVPAATTGTPGPGPFNRVPVPVAEHGALNGQPGPDDQDRADDLEARYGEAAA